MSTYHLNRQATIGACLVSAAGALVFNAFPQLLTAIAIQFEMGEAQVGTLISAYMGAFALVSLFAPLWMPRIPFKLTSIIAYIVVGVGVVMLGQVAKDQVATAMFIMGLGSSVLFTISVGVLSSAKDPDSAYGWMFAVDMVVGAVLVYVVANIVAGMFGYSGFVYGTLALYALTGIGILWLPNIHIGNAEKAAKSESTNSGFNFSAFLASLSLFIFFAAVAAIWSFAGIIGQDHQLSEGVVNSALTFALLSGIGGAMISAWMGQRFGQSMPLIGGLLAMIGSCLLLTYGVSAVAFFLAVCAINALLQFVLAYLMGLITEVDISGRYTVLIPFFFAFGAAISGDLMGGFIESNGLVAAMIAAVITIVIAMLLAVIVLKKEQSVIENHTAEVA